MKADERQAGSEIEMAIIPASRLVSTAQCIN
jgi:hypothetical protein